MATPDLTRSPWSIFATIAARHALETEVVNDRSLRFSSARVHFHLTSSERDGTDLTFGRVQAVGAPNSDEAECISLATVLGTIDAAHRMNLVKPRDPQVGSLDLASAFDLWLPKLLSADASLFDTLSRLRFWHTGDWPSQWGKTVAMTAAENHSNTKLIALVASALRSDG